MSSYVVSKNDYAMVAGFVAGLCSLRNGLWLYHDIKGCKYNDSMIYNSFMRVYDLNRFSVQSQYREKEPENDPDDYMQVFQAYKQKAVFHHTETIYFFKIVRFVSCVKYQIEDDEMSKKASAFLNKIIYSLADYYSNFNLEDGWDNDL